jgi:hypothetical protein
VLADLSHLHLFSAAKWMRQAGTDWTDTPPESAITNPADNPSRTMITMAYSRGYNIALYQFGRRSRSLDVQIAARHADPRATMRYARTRKNLDRHPNYLLAGLRHVQDLDQHAEASNALSCREAGLRSLA